MEKWSLRACGDLDLDCITPNIELICAISHNTTRVCMCVGLSVCCSVCVCVPITQKNNKSVDLKLEHVVVYENSLDDFDIGHCPIKIKVKYFLHLP